MCETPCLKLSPPIDLGPLALGRLTMFFLQSCATGEIRFAVQVDTTFNNSKYEDGMPILLLSI